MGTHGECCRKGGRTEDTGHKLAGKTNLFKKKNKCAEVAEPLCPYKRPVKTGITLPQSKEPGAGGQPGTEPFPAPAGGHGPAHTSICCASHSVCSTLFEQP